MKQPITEEMHLEKEWFEEAGKVKTSDELKAFADHILNDYEHDYGTACHAVAACALAGAWLGCEKEGLSGFQAGFVMWDFIRNWTYTANKCGLKIVDYDDMLYPQYEERFDKTIRKDHWEEIQQEARRKLKEEHGAHPAVIAHWQSIAEGVVPFGYRVVED